MILSPLCVPRACRHSFEVKEVQTIARAGGTPAIAILRYTLEITVSGGSLPCGVFPSSRNRRGIEIHFTLTLYRAWVKRLASNRHKSSDHAAPVRQPVRHGCRGKIGRKNPR